MDVQSQVDQLQSGIKPQNEKRINSLYDGDAASKVALDALILHIEDKALLQKTSMSAMVEDDDPLYDDVDDVRFKSVHSLLVLIALMYEYIECASKLPPIAYDVENKLIELFSMFNSKTCQLVLGAGAMQCVHLKAITAKHLALAQQAISVLLILCPVIHSKWFIKIIPKNCLPLIQSQINRLHDDLEQHSNEIFKKLISIMEELINFKFGSDHEGQYGHYLCRQIGTVRPGGKGRDSVAVRVHPSITSLMNECRKMYKLMATYMQSYQISVIFKPIVMQFEMKLTELIGRVKQMHLEEGQSANNIKDEDNEDGAAARRRNKEPRRDMTEALHSLNMSIKFISDKLNRLSCDAQHLTALCIEID